MDLKKNLIPEEVQKIHLVAVCGTGMGALACILKDLGYTVSGSDGKVYPPMSTFLHQRGIHISEGFAADHITASTDLVIIGNAVRKDNPEALAVRDRGIPYCSMPQAINRFAARGKKILLIAGTHGKTTTSSLLAWVLHHAGLDPSFFIGGILNNFGSNYRIGRGDYMIVEGDEYDTAFFDKGPKFMHYSPHTAALTSVEFDHADIFEDMNHVRRIFRTFVSALPRSGALLAFDADPVIDELAGDSTAEVLRYGRNSASPWRLGEVTLHPPGARFEVFKQNRHFGRFETRLPGDHNLFNALAVIGIADRLGIPSAVIGEALAGFEGVKRRQEVRGIEGGITVMDDFAHHPTAVRETIKAVKPFYPQGRLIAVFEPRTNTSMRDIFQEDYPESFDAADLICIRHPPLLEKIPAGRRFSSERLVADLQRRGKAAHYFPDTDAIIAFLVREAAAGDLVLIMSNGGFDNIHQRLLERLGQIGKAR
jgi:UDP-N-acetylmuramate: L-alanyl-gamma-D-glutamyl-meso-diaminopimelate ligase